MSVVEKTCRTCGKTFNSEDGSGLYPLYDSTEYETESKMALEEFEIWNLNITQNDGLPQKICIACFDSFCQIHNFRLMCIEAQMNFSEMCTGLDIIIKNDEIADEDDAFRENSDSQQYIIVQEHYTFPGDEHLKAIKESKEELTNLASSQGDENESKIQEDLSDENKEDNEYDIDLKKHHCEYCMGFVSFDDPDELNKHYNELHSSLFPYPCPKCDLSFDRLAKRNSHVRCHFDSTPIQCKHCGKKFRGDKTMMAHHIAYYHVDKDRECPICHLKFEKISLKKYYYHMKWHNDSKLLKCKFCDKKFIQSPHLQAHEKTHTSETNFVCTLCGLGLKNSFFFNRHMQSHENKELVECPRCPKKYFTRIGIKLHNQKSHNPNKKPVICELCQRTFPYTHDLLVHNHKKHNGPVPKAKKRTGRPISAASAALKIIKKHKKREFIKPFKCDKCEEAYVLEVQLKRHLKMHDEYRPHQCKFCNKSFKRDAHLKLHVNSLHFKKKPHKCSLCGASYVQKSHLSDHIAIKHDVNKRNYQCKICQRKFGTCQILKTHMAIHSDDRPHVCTICDKGFKQLMVLKSHMTRVHFWKNELIVPKKEKPTGGLEEIDEITEELLES